MLPTTPRLVRRAAIRRILTGRYGREGIGSIRQLKAILEHPPYNLKASLATLSGDLKAMGAFLARDPTDPASEFWMIPPFNPGIEDARSQLDPEIIEREVAYKVVGHVNDVVPIGRMVYVMTAHQAGPIVGYWMSLLSWPEIIAVQKDDSLVLLHCLTSGAATAVAERLVGYNPNEEEAEEDDSEDQDGE